MRQSLNEYPLTEDELQYSDGIPMETQMHVMQLQLLMDPLKLYWKGQDVYVGGNMFVYFSPDQVKNEDFRSPDFFVVLDVANRVRKSWVTWQEGKVPDIVIELISESKATGRRHPAKDRMSESRAANFDKTNKKLIYQDKLRVPEYFWHDPLSGELAGFLLRDGVYEEIISDKGDRTSSSSEGNDVREQGKDCLVSERVNLCLTRWKGEYQEVSAVWLRWSTKEGDLLPTLEEEHKRANVAESKTEQLAQKLKALGINPDEVYKK